MLDRQWLSVISFYKLHGAFGQTWIESTCWNHIKYIGICQQLFQFFYSEANSSMQMNVILTVLLFKELDAIGIIVAGFDSDYSTNLFLTMQRKRKSLQNFVVHSSIKKNAVLSEQYQSSLWVKQFNKIWKKRMTPLKPKMFIQAHPLEKIWIFWWSKLGFWKLRKQREAI